MADPNQPRQVPPDQIHWKSRTSDDPFFAETEPTFPEGAWSDNTATVDEVLDEGRKYQVMFEGSYWTAIPLDSETKLQVGEVVVVMGREGNELIVNATD
jgi:membrane-bound ClpP family serine protease